MRQMKDSGIEWIGKIPETWDVCRFKTLHEKANVGESIDKEFCTENYSDTLFYTAGLKPIYTTYKDFPSWKYVDANDLLLARNGTPYVYLPLAGAVYSDHIIRTPIKKNVDKFYIRYCLQQAIASVVVDTVSIATWSVSVWDKQFLPIPPLKVQHRIANYLDEKCGEIDSLIGLQEQMIEKLKAYKQSVITEAVTKGLDAKAKLVHSGIDWIGEIPSHWGIVKVGFIFKNLDNLRKPISAELRERNNPQYDYYGASGVIDKIDHYNVDDKVLLIGEDGANLVMRNLPLIYKAEGKFWVNNHAHILKPRRDDYDYMAHVLEACNYRDYITGSAQPKLSQENLSRVQLPVPPLTEQHAIASYLDSKCSDIDRLIVLKQRKIESLTDYKKSVIYEAVTGKTIIE